MGMREAVSNSVSILKLALEVNHPNAATVDSILEAVGELESALSQIDGSKAEPVAWYWECNGPQLTTNPDIAEEIAGYGDNVRPLVFADAIPAPTAQDDLDREKLREAIVGMEVSVDVSTGDHDAGHRLFGTVCEVMDNPTGKHEFMLLVADAESNGDTGEPTAQDSKVPEGASTLVNQLEVLKRMIKKANADIGHAVIDKVIKYLSAVPVPEGSHPDCETCGDGFPYVCEHKKPVPDKPQSNAISEFFDMAEELENTYPFLYVEIARTRVTDWMAWFKDKPGDAGSVLSQGQGSTPAEACRDALTGLQRPAAPQD